MRVHRAILSAALAALFCIAPAVAQDTTPVSAQARSIFEQSRESVAQIRVLLGNSNSHTSTGTGFVIGAGGVMLTNYHVVADKALEPDTYRLEFVLPGGRRGALRILALDVIHDLAVVQGDVGDAQPLAFRAGELAKGDRAYSLGYPLDQGLTVTEGTYNGRSEELYYQHFHFTGALNAGMSGGPALDARGRVFAVNVATNLRGQLVSLLVPASYARQLVERALKGPPETDFRKVVGAQLRKHGEDLMSTVLKEKMSAEQVSEFSLPGKVGDFTRCGAATDREIERWYRVDSYWCRTASSLYIDPRLHTGTVYFAHSLLRSDRLGPLRFAHLQEERFTAGGSGADRKHHTRYACRDSLVQMKGTRAKMVICVRAYRRFEGLYDVVVKLATLGSTERALHSALEMHGVPFEPAMTFAHRYVERLEWKR